MKNIINSLTLGGNLWNPYMFLLGYVGSSLGMTYFDGKKILVNSKLL